MMCSIILEKWMLKIIGINLQGVLSYRSCALGSHWQSSKSEGILPAFKDCMKITVKISAISQEQCLSNKRMNSVRAIKVPC